MCPSLDSWYEKGTKPPVGTQFTVSRRGAREIEKEYRRPVVEAGDILVYPGYDNLDSEPAHMSPETHRLWMNANDGGINILRKVDVFDSRVEPGNEMGEDQ